MFFKNQVQLYPGRPENYALLAQLYLRDDKVPQAEQILRAALLRWSRCPLFYTLMMEAYQRGKKSDEMEELIVKLGQIDDQLPQVINHRIQEALANEEFQKTEDLLAQLKKNGYNPEYVYQIEMGLLGKQKEIDKLVSVVAEAHAKYPLNWDFANFQALIESEIHHDPEKAAEVVNDYLGGDLRAHSAFRRGKLLSQSRQDEQMGRSDETGFGVVFHNDRICLFDGMCVSTGQRLSKS